MHSDLILGHFWDPKSVHDQILIFCSFSLFLELDLVLGARGFHVSNPPVLQCMLMKASLDVFAQTSMEELCAKSRLLTGYLEMLVERNFTKDKAASQGMYVPVCVCRQGSFTRYVRTCVRVYVSVYADKPCTYLCACVQAIINLPCKNSILSVRSAFSNISHSYSVFQGHFFFLASWFTPIAS